MKPKRQITAIEAGAIMISSIIGVGVLPLPLFAVRAADSGAPLVTLLGMLVALIGVILFTVLGMRFPRMTLVQYSRSVIGRAPAFVLNLVLVIYFSAITAMTAREFGEVVITAVLKNTPVEVTVVVMLILAAISARNDITTFAYIHYFYLPFLLVPVLLIVGLSLKNADVINLLPVWGNEHREMIPGVLLIAMLFQAAFTQTAVIPAMRQPSRALTASLVGLLVSGGLYITISAATVAVFGAEETKLLLWPTLELAKATSLPANVLERLDAAFLAVWVTAVFTTLLSLYFWTIRSLADLFKVNDHKLFSPFLLPFVFVMAMLPQNVVQMYEMIGRIGFFGVGLLIGYPALLLVIAVARKKRGDAVDRIAADSGSTG